MDELIISDLMTAYGIDVTDTRPNQVDGGWLNCKWGFTHNRRELLLKQFSRRRYDDRKLRQINDALKWQKQLYSLGVPCPMILDNIDGQPLRFVPYCDTVYMVMEFVGGCIGDRTTVNYDQLYSLGRACHAMKCGYAELTRNLADISSAKGYPFDSESLVCSLKNYRAELLASDAVKTDEQFCRTAHTISAIVDSLDTAQLDRLERGLSHEDLSPDNMLFYPDKLSVILDFDRGQYSLVLHDIGRILTSLALDIENGFDMERVRAFMRGYDDISMSDIADAVRCVWLIEAPWWINGSEYFYTTPKVRRFCDELLWISEHYFELDDIFCESEDKK